MEAHELVPLWDARAVGRGLGDYATVPSHISLAHEIEIELFCLPNSHNGQFRSIWKCVQILGTLTRMKITTVHERFLCFYHLKVLILYIRNDIVWQKEHRY